MVFEHDQEYDDGAVGIQVVGGGVNEGETLKRAALRETFEESGLTLERAVFLGTSHYESKFGRLEGQKQVRHYFWLEAPLETPDMWSHTVSSGELDKGMVFHHRFVPLEQAELVFGMGEMLDILRVRMGFTNIKDFRLSTSHLACVCLFNSEGEVLYINDVTMYERDSWGGGGSFLPFCHIEQHREPILRCNHFFTQVFSLSLGNIEINKLYKIVDFNCIKIYLCCKTEEDYRIKYPLSEVRLKSGDEIFTEEAHWRIIDEYVFGTDSRRVYEFAYLEIMNE